MISKIFKNLLFKKYLDHEKPACFVVGPNMRESYFDGWVVWFLKSDLIQGVSPEID